MTQYKPFSFCAVPLLFVITRAGGGEYGGGVTGGGLLGGGGGITSAAGGAETGRFGLAIPTGRNST